MSERAFARTVVMPAPAPSGALCVLVPRTVLVKSLSYGTIPGRAARFVEFRVRVSPASAGFVRYVRMTCVGGVRKGTKSLIVGG